MNRFDEDNAGALDYEEFRALMIELLVKFSKKTYEMK